MDLLFDYKQHLVATSRSNHFANSCRGGIHCQQAGLFTIAIIMSCEPSFARGAFAQGFASQHFASYSCHGPSLSAWVEVEAPKDRAVRARKASWGLMAFAARGASLIGSDWLGDGFDFSPNSILLGVLNALKNGRLGAG